MRIVSGRPDILSAVRVIGATFFLGLTASGCASVKLSMPGQDKSAEDRLAGAYERSALISATRELERTPWPAVTEQGLSTRMVNVLFGAKSDNDGISRDEALNLYTARLSGQPDPASALMRDADLTLRQARQVAEAGRLAAIAIKPSSSDIAVLESAIADVRQSREMYLDALQVLKRQGHDITREQQRELKEAFSQTIEDIGATADLVAERVAETRPVSQYASQSGAANNGGD